MKTKYRIVHRDGLYRIETLTSDSTTWVYHREGPGLAGRVYETKNLDAARGTLGRLQARAELNHGQWEVVE